MSIDRAVFPRLRSGAAPNGAGRRIIRQDQLADVSVEEVEAGLTLR